MKTQAAIRRKSLNMTLSRLFMLYCLTAVVFFIIDIVWLGWIARDFYQRQLGDFFRERVLWGAAVVFYLFFIFGLLIFTVVPALRADSLGDAVIYGILFGLVTYSTYDLTNLATLKGWPFRVVVVDILWGIILSSMVSVAGFFIGKWLLFKS
jgi:uncharacterized membrane protein